MDSYWWLLRFLFYGVNLAHLRPWKDWLTLLVLSFYERMSCLVSFYGSLLGFSVFLRLVRLIWTRLWSVATSRGHSLHRSAQLVQLTSWGWTISPPHYFLTSALSHCRFGHWSLHRHLNNSEEDWKAAWKNSFRQSGFEPRSKRLRSSRLRLNQLTYQVGP